MMEAIMGQIEVIWGIIEIIVFIRLTQQNLAVKISCSQNFLQRRMGKVSG
jgi:hypothetical protein